MTRPPRGLLAGTCAALAIVWGLYAVNGGHGLLGPAIQSGVYLGLLLLTMCSRTLKIRVVRVLQRWLVNPLMQLPLLVGVNPLGLAVLETTGRVSGRPRRVPVGNGRMGNDFWIIAEHGLRANYVRNIARNPQVRLRLRTGLRYRWVHGVATVLPDDDPLARQRRVIAWHPLRTLNAINVRVLGADLVTVHVRLLSGTAAPPANGAATVNRAQSPMPARSVRR